jgi:flagellin
MFELAEQSANGTYSDNVDREQLQKEVEKLNKEIDRIRDSSNFNGTKLLNGSLGGKTYAEESDYLSGFSVTGGGTFMSGDTLKMKHASDGTVSIEDLTVGGVALVSGGTPSTSAGVEIGDAVKSPDGTGTWVFQIKASDVDTTKAVSDVAKAIGDGMTITVTTKANPAANDDQEYELALDADSSLKLQIGDTADSFNQMEVSVGDISTSVLGSSSLKLSDIDISQQGSAQAAMDAIKEAINTVSDIRGSLGATQNRLEHTINNLSVMQENIQDAESTIRDTDVAAEMMKYTKNSILVQSAQAMLAQANQQPQGVLQLLQ